MEFKRERERCASTGDKILCVSLSFLCRKTQKVLSDKHQKQRQRRERDFRRIIRLNNNNKKNELKRAMIARVLDGLPLAEGLDTDATLDLEYYKQQAKTLFKKLSSGAVPPSRMSYESGEYFMHYVIENGCAT